MQNMQFRFLKEIQVIQYCYQQKLSNAIIQNKENNLNLRNVLKSLSKV